VLALVRVVVTVCRTWDKKDGRLFSTRCLLGTQPSQADQDQPRQASVETLSWLSRLKQIVLQLSPV